MAYVTEENPKIAVELLIGHGVCRAIIEISAVLDETDIEKVIACIAGSVKSDIVIVPQDSHLARNQAESIYCGDNGIFKGMPLTDERKALSQIARDIYKVYPYNGKYIFDDEYEELEEIDRCMAGLQEKLVMSVNDNEKHDSITKQIDILRGRKALILSKGAECDAMQK